MLKKKKKTDRTKFILQAFFRKSLRLDAKFNMGRIKRSKTEPANKNLHFSRLA